jgi:hypothetical protein
MYQSAVRVSAGFCNASFYGDLARFINELLGRLGAYCLCWFKKALNFSMDDISIAYEKCSLPSPLIYGAQAGNDSI